MSSLWRQFTGEQPKKLIGGIHPLSIPKALHEYTERWVSKPGMTAKVAPQNGLEFLLYRNGKLCGSVWIEHMSPPTKPDPGDTRAVQPPKEPA